ncbi:MAG TPA: hypothetical protein VJP78_05815, partial [Thermoleophilia bacterium]|nr:hypothetical protein [Thermoleophilia bacterium]
PLHGLPAYGAAKLAEDPRLLADPKMKDLVERHLREDWTLAKVAAMSTDAIEEQLRAGGVRYARESFLAQASQRFSAWSFAEQWLETDPVIWHGKKENFLGMAACELWKRLMPERPSMEMLDDWTQEGYALADEGHEADACDVWWRVWQHLHGRLTPQVSTTDAAGPIFQGLQRVGNWCGDFEMQLHNAALDEPRYAQVGRQFCEEWLAQFPDEDGSTIMTFTRALGNFLLRLGDTRGEAVLVGITERWPDSPWGYVALADEYARQTRAGSPLPRDLARAREWLERGLARVKEDRHALEERLRDYDDSGGKT